MEPNRLPQHYSAPCEFTSAIRTLRAAAKDRAPPLTLNTINPKVKQAEYAVRGEIVIRGNAYKQRLLEGDKTLPFSEVVECNVGNPQAVSQKPITFVRQVLALITYPQLLDAKGTEEMFAKDAVAKAKEFLAILPAGSGAYSHSMGHRGIRVKVANFIERRDGYKSDPEKIFLTDGASRAVKMALEILIRGPEDGIMVCVPQYPLYSASISLMGGTRVDYYLDEKNGWKMSIAELKRAYERATANGVSVRALVVINPGNPTGQCMEEKDMREVVKFCADTGMVLLADEVYQTNVYSDVPFVSFKKVVSDLDQGMDPSRRAPLISFHSTSKGFLGECGRRGGYMELHNIDEEVRLQLYKVSSVSLCSNIDGQIMTGLMVDPPIPGMESFDLYNEESSGTIVSLAKRAEAMVAGLNSLEGVTCNPVEGALYAFPKITLPKRAIEAATKAGKSPDLFYCLNLLDETGILVVPGSGFGQSPDTFHFRTTILPPLDKMAAITGRLADFHRKFMRKYS